MSANQQKIANALKENNNKKEKVGKEIIKKLENNPDALKDV